MKYATPALVNLLRSNTRLPFANCFKLVTNYGADVGQLAETALGNPTGQTFFWTDSDADVQDGNFLYLSSGPSITGVRYKLTKGLSVDEQTITFYADSSDILTNGVPVIQTIGAGLLDGARFEQRRAFFDPATWPSRPGDPNKAVGTVILFAGRTTVAEEVGRTSAKMKVKSDLSLLDVDMPRNLYQPSCLNTLYDGMCGLKKTLFLVPAVAATGSSASIVLWSNTYAASYFAQGVLKFTSGANKGQSRPIRASGTTGITLAYPLQFAPANGDTFIVYPGCDHTKATCGTKFLNDRNFRGFPYVPPPETAV